jgi:hypothetical protein
LQWLPKIKKAEGLEIPRPLKSKKTAGRSERPTVCCLLFRLTHIRQAHSFVELRQHPLRLARNSIVFTDNSIAIELGRLAAKVKVLFYLQKKKDGRRCADHPSGIIIAAAAGYLDMSAIKSGCRVAGKCMVNALSRFRVLDPGNVDFRLAALFTFPDQISALTGTLAGYIS